MSKKIGRNEPCPCGSGKKYKHCCMQTERAIGTLPRANHALWPDSWLDAPKTIAYLSNHAVPPILDYLTAMQLNPQNRGKNIRIEHLLQIAVANLGKSSQTPDISKFKSIIDQEFSFDLMEDLPINMFSEPVVFYGGNYTFFPGISTHATEIFRSMTEAIFNKGNIFTGAFRNEVYDGVVFMLELSNILSTRVGISGLVLGNGTPREMLNEPKTNQSLVITLPMMAEIINRNRLDRNILKSFLLEVNAPNILTQDADKDPLLYRPIVEFDNNFYFVGISSQGCAINNFILKTARKHHCLEELVKQTHYGVWMRIGHSCIEQMSWVQNSMDDILAPVEGYYEDVFRIDVNWLAYVCYAHDLAHNVAIDGNDSFSNRDLSQHLQKRIDAIRNDKRSKDDHILTLVLYSTMGETYGFAMEKQNGTDYFLQFSAYDFLQLIQTEKWDSLSLVRYARSKENVSFLETPMNQSLDVYALYKHYGESFYMTDDTPSYMLYIEPNDGYDLIFKSKDQLYLHGTLKKLNGRYAHIPVIRDLEYAAIFKPVHSVINAKSCESYNIPVWVNCCQEEKQGINPSSISDTVITAVAYWMDILQPALADMISQHYECSVEIELVFSGKVLVDKGIHYDNDIKPSQGGNLTTSKTESGVTVTFDDDYIHSFLGAGNESERTMMRCIITELLGIDEEKASQIIDSYIPLSQAKMILMTEQSRNPLAIPLWLYTPIYIHAATSQLLLDKFPQWMKENGHDIEGKLNTKTEKVTFLHKGVDVLLDELARRLSSFDTLWLLRMLMQNHETLVYQREHNRILQPAQVLCFGENESRRNEFLVTEKRLTDAGISTRALIEYLAATQYRVGDVKPGNDDIESLLAIMNEVISIGGICDAIHLDVANHTIEKLNSGRYGIYDDNFSDNMEEFATMRTFESVNGQIEDFESKMARMAVRPDIKEKNKDAELEEIDVAFLEDWGVSYSNILQFLYVCYIIAMKQQKSVIEMEESQLVKAVQEHCIELTEDLVRKCIIRLSLDKRENYLTPPNGLAGKDIYPWSYNRELSYLRRPVIRYQYDDGTVMCMFGFRSCIQAGVQLSDLLYSGRLRYVGRKIETLLGKFEARKGFAFNDEVRSFLAKIPMMRVWEHDVTIKSGGYFSADKDYGDIDVMAYDTSSDILYLIECKNTNTARNIKEMKTEMDEYLGRGDNPEKDKKRALVLKHLRRHRWVTEHINEVAKRIGLAVPPRVKSMMLTATVIPTSYLKREKTPMSILNYPELKIKGMDYLNSCKEPDLSVLEI